MKESQQSVQAFHEAFQLPISRVPTLPDPLEQRLRLELIEEELDELDEAFLKGDLVQVADAIGDLLYVVLGTAVTCGIDMDPIFREIHRSNMTKQGGHKAPNGKWIKPSTYEPAKLAPLIAHQQEPVSSRMSHELPSL